MSNPTTQHAHEGNHTEHVDNPGSLFLTFLMVGGLTILTVVLSTSLTGPTALIAQLGIACVQSVILLRNFMHLKYADTVTWLTVGSGVFWLMILFVLGLVDFLTRQYGSL